MTKPAALRATYSDLKLIKTRQCVQIVFEVPLAEFDAAYEVLGGMPNGANERWFGIAALTGEGSPQPDAARKAGGPRSWNDLGPAQQAGIRCEEPVFVAFLKEVHLQDWRESNEAAACVRLICGVQSRSELGSNQKARVLWHQLNDEFIAWKALENA